MRNKLFGSLFLGLGALLTLEASPTPLLNTTQVQLIDTAEGQNVDSLQDVVSKQFEKFVKGNKALIQQYEGFVRSLKKASEEEKSLQEKDVDHILKALAYAAECHQFQTRKNVEKTPYISHPIGVAETLVTVGKVRDANVIMAALLHDVVEDTQGTFQEIRNRFGEKVEGYVREVTDDKNLSAQKRKKLQIVNAAHKSEGAAMIKLSDKLYNLNDLIHNPPADWSRERIDQYFQWAQTVVENLPEANAPLKEAVHKVIHQYWESQA